MASTARSKAASPAGTERTSLSRPSTTKATASSWKSPIGLRRSSARDPQPVHVAEHQARARARRLGVEGLVADAYAAAGTACRSRSKETPIRVPPCRSRRKRRGQHQRSDPRGPCVRPETGMRKSGSIVGALREYARASRQQALTRLDFCYALVTIGVPVMPAHLYAPFRKRLDAFTNELEQSKRATSRPSITRAWPLDDFANCSRCCS